MRHGREVGIGRKADVEPQPVPRITGDEPEDAEIHAAVVEGAVGDGVSFGDQEPGHLAGLVEHDVGSELLDHELQVGERSPGQGAEEDVLHRPHGAFRTRGVLDRTAALDEMVKVAAHGDPALRDLEAALGARRRDDVEALVALLAAAGPLRMPQAEAVDIIWAVATSDLHLRLRRGCGWPAAQVDDLIEHLIARIVLPDDPR